MIGASIYVGLEEYPLERNLEYLDLLKKHNIGIIFTSAHIPEADTNAINDLNIIIQRANQLGIKIILDVSKPMFKDFIMPKGVYSLRLDWGFTLDDMVALSKEEYFLDLNGSTINRDMLLYLKEKNVDFSKLRISHNFYPKPFTALSHKAINEKNKMFREFGLPILIFIPSQFGKRPPIKEGLPTIEYHRHAHLLSILSERKLLNVDEICFGDAYCDESELELINKFKDDELIIPIKVTKSICKIERDILKQNQVQRMDVNDYFVRSSIRETRTINPYNCIARNKYSITIDNKNFLRYQGEVSIMKQNLEKDDRVNVVGRAEISEELLMNIAPGQKFRFEIVGEIDE